MMRRTPAIREGWPAPLRRPPVADPAIAADAVAEAISAVIGFAAVEVTGKRQQAVAAVVRMDLGPEAATG